ncbi:hypothetical protein EB796_000113 [Bugula neritina]|uniref:Uncharacterized protein n=1 Tax=Bugula neritina TaxID=10212 RepID=A0A7J7KTR3_BUGNE|nr:hypothetical protein EB796_000113 [Bugula neritina]
MCSQVVEKSSEALGLQHLESSKPHTYLTDVREAIEWNQLIQGESLGTEQTVKDASDKAYSALHKNISLLAVHIKATYEHNSHKLYVNRTFTKLKGKPQNFDPGPQLTRTNVN